MSYAMFLPEYSEMLTPDDIRHVLKVGRNTVYDSLKSGKLKSYMIAGKYRIPKIFLWEFLYPGRKFSDYGQSSDDPANKADDERKDDQ